MPLIKIKKNKHPKKKKKKKKKKQENQFLSSKSNKVCVLGLITKSKKYSSQSRPEFL
jgi:23S rRNA pseudoU1915 N3-methylase RlmH